MRERLTLAFVTLTLVTLAAALFTQSWSFGDQIERQRVRDLHQQATSTGIALEQQVELGDTVDPSFLATLVSPTGRLSWQRSDQEPIVAQGDRFAVIDSDGDDDVSQVAIRVDAAGGRLTLTDGGAVATQVLGADRRTVVGLLLLGGLLAGLVGWLVARRLAAPFRQLAVAADLLGRGRFELDLPQSRVPEVKAISEALRGAAGRQQERLTREQDFAEHASHVLRTPLTGLRLELEELSLRPDVPPDARETVIRSLDRVDSMDVVAGELVKLSRRGSLVSGAEVTLRELATQSAQRWADVLAETDRPLTAAAEGDLETTYTPGPVEHILDLLLVDILRRGTGSVRMVFESDPDGNLKIRLTCAGEVAPTPGAGTEVPVNQARAVVQALGGRLRGDGPGDGVEVLLPRR